MPSQKFSEELITRGQKYFEKKYGIRASKEEMDLWLDRLTALAELANIKKVNDSNSKFIS